MPVTYRFDSNIVVIETVGEFSINDILKVLLDSFADSNYPANARLLIDFGESQDIYQRSPAEMLAMSTIASNGYRFKNRLVVVAQKDLLFGLMRKDSIDSEEHGFEIGIFRNIVAAREWLLSKNPLTA